MPHQCYTVRQLLQIQACTNCQACAHACPVVTGSLDGKLSAVYRLATLGRILKQRTGIWQKLGLIKTPTAEYLRAFGETVFRCTLCGNCRQVCPVGIDLTPLWHSVRQDLVDSDAYPEKIDMIRDNLNETHNVFGEENDERAEWVEDIPDAPDHGYIKNRADIVYFTGCVSSFFPLAQQIPMALVKIFNRACIDFTLLGDDEWCCGFPQIGAGLHANLKNLIDHNIEAVHAKGADTIVFSCPSCYQMWREHYPHDFKIYHATQYIDRLITTDQLPLKAINMTVTYHDPCDLGRGSCEYEAPRRLLRAIPDVKLVEMTHHRENCLCCGGGGNLEMIDSRLSGEIAREKINEALATGAQAVVTACQQCVRVMTTYVRRNKIKLEVMDIIQLVQKALKN